MKKQFAVIFLTLITSQIFCQEKYDFEVESRFSSERIRKIDSISYYATECTATYPAYGIFKSHMPGRYNLLEYCKKNKAKIYKKIKSINTSCKLYQYKPENELIFDLCENSTIDTFDFEQNHKVKCKLLILTIYEGEKQEIVRLITSMKQIK